MASYRLAAVSVMLIAIVFAGCTAGKSNSASNLRRKTLLSKLGLAYHVFNAQKGHGPTGVDEFAEFLLKRAPDDALTNAAVDWLKNGDVVLIWNAVLSQNGADNDRYVLGYEKRIRETGGFMVTGGGFVKQVSPDEFNQILRIPTKPPKQN